MTIWLTILGMALVTFGTRWLPFTIVREENLPEWARRGLVYVPVAVLSAIIAPEFLPHAEWGKFIVDGHLVAGIVAIAVAWYSRNVLLTIGVGLLVLLLLS